MPKGSKRTSKSKGSKGSKGSKNAKGSKAGKGKEKTSLSPEELEQQCFGRRLYENTEAVFVKRSKNIVLFCQRIHIYEILHLLPEIFTEIKPFGDSDTKNDSRKSKSSKGSKGKASKGKGARKSKKKEASKKGKGGKGSKKGEAKSKAESVVVEETPEDLEFEAALLVGAVAFPICLVNNGGKIYVEVSADFAYYDYAKEPPYPASVVCKACCYKDAYSVYPINVDRLPPYLEFTQNMVVKIKEEYPSGWHVFPFYFDLSGKPDSVLFSRPGFMRQNTGLFWTIRAFAGMSKSCIPPPENEASMNFYKFTIAPVVKPSVNRPSVKLDYNRWRCLEDEGALRLSASLSKDVYYQGEEIEVNVAISNDSARHSVVAMSVCVEQVYKLNSEIPHDNSIPLAIIYVRGGEMGLPVGPKNKGWSNTFNLLPVFNPRKYNLAMDGRMPQDHKAFLAESTVIVQKDKVKIEEPKPPQPEDEAEKKGSKGSKKGKGKTKGKGKSAGKNNSKSSKADKSKKGKKAKGSKGKGSISKAKGNADEKKPDEATEKPKEDENCKPEQYKEVTTIIGRQECRIIDISYEVVVRLTLGNEGGQPMVRVPFVLTRNSRYIDKLLLMMSTNH